MILDSEDQKQLLQSIMESTTFSAKPDTLNQVAINVQSLRLALNNAQIKVEDPVDLAMVED